MSTLRRKVGHRGEDATTAYLKANGSGDLTGYIHISYSEIEIPAGQDQLAVFVVWKRHTFLSITYPEAAVAPCEQTDLLPTLETYLDNQSPREPLHLAIRPDCSRKEIF
jgi:Holliday junction resolvase-like predicted endonuclease